MISPVTHGYYVDEKGLMSLEDENYLAIPEQYRSPEDICRYQEREVIRLQEKGKLSEVLKQLRKMEASCGSSTPRAVQTLFALVQFEDYQQAVLLGADLVAHMESDERKDTRLLPRVYHSYAYALARTGKADRALYYAEKAREMGLGECGVYEVIAHSAERREKWAVSARSAEVAFQCQLEVEEKAHLNLLQNAILLWRKSGDENNAERVKQLLKSVTTP